MTARRRWLRVLLYLSAVLVGTLVLALVVSQTPWFRDWVRRTAMRQAERVIDGQLVIGRLEGTFFSGVTLRDVSVVQNGSEVVTLERVGVSYGLSELLSDGRIVAHLRVTRPVIHAIRTEQGWNLARLLKARTPSRPDTPRPTFALPDIVVTDGTIVVEGDGVEPAAAIPRRITNLEFTGGVRSGPEALTVDVRSLSLVAEQPALALHSVSGRLINGDDGWRFDGLDVVTGESSVRVDGRLFRREPGEPLAYDLTVQGRRLSLPEIGRFVPVVAALDVHPVLTAQVTGTTPNLHVELEMTSEAGAASGPLTIDTRGAGTVLTGTLAVKDVNLALWLNQPSAAGRITGTAVFDLKFPSQTSGVLMDGSYTFQGPEVVAYGYEATDVTARGSLDGRRVGLDARAAAYGGRATARGHIDRPGPGRPQVALSLAGRVDGVDLRRLPASLQLPALDTSVSGTYTVDGPLSDLRATASLDGSQIEGARIAEGLTATFDRSPGAYSFEATGDVEDLDLQRLGAALDVRALQDERYRGTVNGAFTVQGTRAEGDVLRLTARGTLRDTRVFNGLVPQMEVEATLAGSTLDVQAKGNVASYDLATLTGVAAMTGTLTGRVDSAVTFTDLDDVRIETVGVDGRFVFDAPTLMGVPFEQITADVRLADGVVDVRTMEGRGDGFTVAGSGALALGTVGASDFTYEVQAASLVDPAKVASLPLTGGATVEGKITGPRDAFHVTGSVQGKEVSYDDTVSAGDVSARFEVDVPDFDTDRLRVSSDLTATSVVTAGLPFEAVEGHVEYVPDQLTFQAVARDTLRTLRGTGTLDLEPARQVLTLRELSVERDTVRWSLAPEATAVLTIGTDRVEVAPVSLVNGAQSVALDGRVALTEEATNDLQIVAKAVDVSDALLLAGQEIDADGALTIDGRLGGSRALPTLSGQVDVESGRYRQLDIAAIHATVEDDGRLARVDAIIRQSDLAYITAKGVVPRTLFTPVDETSTPAATEDRLDLAIESTDIDLRLAEGLTDQLRDLTGHARMDVRLTNSGRSPIVDGDVTITDGGFVVTATGVPYTNFNAALDFEKDRLLVRHLSMESKGGHAVVVAGEIGLRNALKGNVALTINGKGIRVLDNHFGQIDVNPALTVSGTLEAPSVEGELVIEEGRLEIDAVLPRLGTGTYATESTYQGIPTYAYGAELPVVPDILSPPPSEDGTTPTTTTPAESRSGPIYEALSLNVRVRIPDSLLLRGRDVELGRSAIGDVNVTMGGDFRVAKTSGQPVVLIGAVNTVRGTYSYQGRRFAIARDGQVLFRGDGTTNPTLDITAERVIQGVEARVRIQGTAEKPTLSLSSDPPLDQADVLALIVFNQPVNQLGTGQQNSLAQRAGGVAAGFAVSPIAQALGNSLDLDLFDVETTDSSGRVNPAVVIGQQLNPDVFVKFRQQFGNQQVSQFLLEYRLADFLRLQTTFAEGDGIARANRSLTQRIERYGADLVFYFRF